MSARTPFVPSGSRPASRAAHIQDQTHGSNTNSQFSVDLCNPLNATPSTGVKHLPRAGAGPLGSKNNLTMSANDNGTKPLNTSTLLKKKNLTTTLPHVQKVSRKLSINENTTEKHRSVDTNSQAQQAPNQDLQVPNRNSMLDIVAPIPRQASPTVSSHLASGVFATNTAQNVFRQPQNDNQPKQNAHISNSVLGFSFAKPLHVSEQQHSQLPSPPTSIHTASTRIFEPVGVENVQLPPFTLNMSLPNQTGPQRVLLNPDGTRMPLSEQIQDANNGQYSERTNTMKRSRPEYDDEAEYQDNLSNYGAKLRRYRSRDDAYNRRKKSTLSHPLSPGSRSIHSQSPSHSPEDTTHDPRQHRSLTPPHRQSDPFVAESPRALDKLLGCSADVYVEDHMDQYERAVEKWKHCTMAEWVAGADEQAARYGKILNYVKDHMTVKMKLFTNFDAKVDGHNIVLKGREKALDTVKERLVHESVNVLGK